MRALKIAGYTVLGLVLGFILLMIAAVTALGVKADPGPAGNALLPLIFGVAASALAGLYIVWVRRRL